MRIPRAIPLALLAWFAALAFAVERPPVTQLRATSGDAAIEPKWTDKLTITVGPDKADLVGATEKVIQAGVDYVARLGGGTVKILPGVYKLRNAVHLQSKVRLLGAGDKTVLVKEPCITTKLAADSDWYDQEITLENAGGFQIGDGVCLRARNDYKNMEDIVKRTLVARTGNRFKLDRPLRENFWKRGNATVSTLFPLVAGEHIADAVIESLALDGNRAKNDNLNGNYAGCIFLQDCNRITIKGVSARNYNGDGISFQICHDTVVENCVCENNAQLGLHPGSGSQRPVIRNNKLKNNDIGIFFCWGVKYGLAEKNQIEGNRVGVSIGHRDTDNLICLNEIKDSREVGVLFRPERGKDFAGHRNRLEKNRLVNNSTASGAAIDIQGATEEITLVGNEIVDTRFAGPRVAVRLGAQTRDIRLRDNTFKGFIEEVKQLK